MKIRPASNTDAEAMWAIFREVSEGADTIPTSTSASKEEMCGDWFDESTTSYVAVEANVVVGMYKLGANQPDLGSHVATATFMVLSSHRGKGVGTALVEHCLSEALAAGFAAIQFNFVVSSNQAALSLYKKIGFSVAGTLPGAFRHCELGYIDAHILFKALAQTGT
jgi:ribosomal protein S18 acetylase RimI-like enzyme